jgi:hypothetical protein
VAVNVGESVVSPSMRLTAAVSSINPAEGGPGGTGGDGGGGAAPAPSKSHAGGGSDGGSGAAPAVGHPRPSKPGTSDSGPLSQLDPSKVLPHPQSSSPGNAGGAAAPASAGVPDASGVGGFINKAFSMIGNAFGGQQSETPGAKPAKPSAASAGARGGDAPEITRDPARKQRPLWAGARTRSPKRQPPSRSCTACRAEWIS